MVILDEINVAVDFNLIPEAEILEPGQRQAAGTGSDHDRALCVRGLSGIADTVSEVTDLNAIMPPVSRIVPE